MKRIILWKPKCVSMSSIICLYEKELKKLKLYTFLFKSIGQKSSHGSSSTKIVHLILHMIIPFEVERPFIIGNTSLACANGK